MTNFRFKSEHPYGGQGHLNEVELASLLNMSERTLQGWRLKGRGPAFLKFGGSVRYSTDSVEAWIAEQGRSSTSATSPEGPCSILQPNDFSVSTRGAKP